ncbi:putative signal peptidase complex subunit Spc1/SPCS1 [Dioscorea sansibarensis]
MGRDEMLRRSLVALGMVVAVVGIVTLSLRKMVVTYAFGIAGIGLIFLPDWEFFDRDFSQWFTPMPGQRRPGSDRAPDPGRFRLYPLRVSLLTIIYCFGLYKWWTIVSS